MLDLIEALRGSAYLAASIGGVVMKRLALLLLALPLAACTTAPTMDPGQGIAPVPRAQIMKIVPKPSLHIMRRSRTGR